jgi:hypothetical protein
MVTTSRSKEPDKAEKMPAAGTCNTAREFNAADRYIASDGPIEDVYLYFYRSGLMYWASLVGPAWRAVVAGAARILFPAWQLALRRRVMRLQRSVWFPQQKVRLIVLLLLPALALGPIGCGAEAIPIIVSTCAVVGLIALTVHEVQQVESAHLDNEMRRLRLRGLRNGLPVTIDTPLTDEQFSKIRSSKEVSVNGTTIPVALSNWIPAPAWAGRLRSAYALNSSFSVTPNSSFAARKVGAPMKLPPVTDEPVPRFIDNPDNARKVLDLESLLPSIKKDGIL